MFKLQNVIAIGLFGLVSASAFSQGVPELKVNSVYAYGTGCKSDVNGEGIDWSYSINHKLKLVDLEFSNFQVIPTTEDGYSDCKIQLNVRFPAGKTIYVYESQVVGEAAIDKGEKGKIRTELTLPSYKSPARNTYDIPAGTDGEFKSKKARHGGIQDAPCGAKEYPIVFHIYALMSGKNPRTGFIQVKSSENAFSRIRYRWDDCK